MITWCSFSGNIMYSFTIGYLDMSYFIWICMRVSLLKVMKKMHISLKFLYFTFPCTSFFVWVVCIQHAFFLQNLSVWQWYHLYGSSNYFICLGDFELKEDNTCIYVIMHSDFIMCWNRKQNNAARRRTSQFLCPLVGLCGGGHAKPT